MTMAYNKPSEEKSVKVATVERYFSKMNLIRKNLQNDNGSNG